MSAEPNTPPVFPRLKTERIAACPSCMGDCIDEGFDFYCPACQSSWTFAQVGYLEEAEYVD